MLRPIHKTTEVIVISSVGIVITIKEDEISLTFLKYTYPGVRLDKCTLVNMMVIDNIVRQEAKPMVHHSSKYR